MIGADRVAAILLAAGRSERFGPSDKLLAPVAGQPLALHAARLLRPMGFARRIAVCAPGASAVADLFAREGYAVVPGAGPGQGMGVSIAHGVMAIGREDIDAVLVMLADMPDMTTDHVARLLAAFDGTRPVASGANGVAMPPALFGRAAFAKLCALAGDRGARDMLDDATVIAADAAILRDVDRPEDLH